MIPVFVISLARSHDRRAFIEKHMNAAVLSILFSLMPLMVKKLSEDG